MVVKPIKLLFILFIFFHLYQCKWLNSDNDLWVVKYKDYELSKQEIKNLVPHGMSAADSTELVDTYIENWLKDKILLDKTDEILSEEQKLEIDRKLEVYKNDLLRDVLENQWLGDVATDSISENEIDAYYQENLRSFILNKDVASVKYISVPADSIDRIKKLFKSNKPEDILELNEIAKTLDYPHQLDNNYWIDFDVFKKTTPLPPISDNKGFLARTKDLNVNDHGNIFLLHIENYALKSDNAPLPYVKETIKNLLINKRKLNLLSQKKNQLYDEALQNNEIKRNE